MREFADRRGCRTSYRLRRELPYLAWDFIRVEAGYVSCDLENSNIAFSRVKNETHCFHL